MVASSEGRTEEGKRVKEAEHNFLSWTQSQGNGINSFTLPLWPNYLWSGPFS
jgi:hypothetical protein